MVFGASSDYSMCYYYYNGGFVTGTLLNTVYHHVYLKYAFCIASSQIRKALYVSYVKLVHMVTYSLQARLVTVLTRSGCCRELLRKDSKAVGTEVK